METNEFSPEIQDIMKMIQEVGNIGKSIEENQEENPDQLIAHLDKYMQKVNKLVEKCDGIDDESFSDDIENYLEEVKET